MKVIYRIARVELATFFYSPIAWLLLAAFMVQSSIDFTSRLIDLEAATAEHGSWSSLTKLLFYEPNSVFFGVQFKLYLFIPLLTMGLISRETSSGSIKLLLSSPVTSIQIVLGKYLAMLLFGLLIFMVLGIYLVTGLIVIDRPDIGPLIAGIFGLYMLFSAYSAIGLFMSSLTTYQIVAAITTFVVFAALNYIGLIWQDCDLIRDLTYYLSLSGRTVDMLKGLITSRDVIYFLMITLFFLALTYLGLLYKREIVPLWRRLATYLLIIFLLISVVQLTSKQGNILFFDLSRGESNTFSSNSQKILKGIKKPFGMTTYVNLLDFDFDEFRPSARHVDLKRLESITRFAPQMEIKYVYYFDTLPGLNPPDVNVNQIAGKIIQDRNLQSSLFINPQTLAKRTDIKNMNNYSMRVAQIGSQRAVIQATYGDLEKHDFEPEFMTGIKRAIEGPSQIYFLTGHNETSLFKRGDIGYNFPTIDVKVRHSLVNMGFAIDTINLKYQDIPKNTDGLVLLDPKWSFENLELSKLQDYIDHGGNLIVAGEARKKNVLKPILQPLGINFLDSTLLQRSTDDRPDLIKSLIVRQPEDIMNNTPDNVQRRKLTMDGATGLRYQNTGKFIIKPLAILDTTSAWLRPGNVEILDSANVRYSPVLGDVKKPVPLVLGLARKIRNRTQMIIVAGDADHFSNRYWGSMANLSFSAFSGNKYPLEFARKEILDKNLHINKSQVFVIKWAYMAVFPGLILLAGSVVLLRRRRK